MEMENVGWWNGINEPIIVMCESKFKYTNGGKTKKREHK